MDVTAGRLSYQLRGEGHPVVLLHSGLIDSWMWDDQMKAFSDRFLVVRYDLRGFGRSTVPSAPYSPVDDLFRLLRSLDIERAALVGLSHGGEIAMDFALEHPSAVTALVVVAASVRGYRDWRPEVWRLWSATETALDQGNVILAQDFELAFWVPSGRFPDSDSRIRRLARRSQKSYQVDPEFETAPERPTIERLEEIRAPTLVVLGEQDVPDIQAIGDVLVARIPGATRATIPRADHLVNLRNPTAFNKVVGEFLEHELG